ncbi:hypothetical protein [Streptomyces sp. NPDC015125]|uniref:hypothetical protein n=1 Tax=Streptomyces sp. NPDC015125 TaxID=3364938 RepID=UPI003702DFCE
MLDEVQFSRRDYQHQARLASLADPQRRQWRTVPTTCPTARQTTLRNALIVEPAGLDRPCPPQQQPSRQAGPLTTPRRPHRRQIVSAEPAACAF